MKSIIVIILASIAFLSINCQTIVDNEASGRFIPRRDSEGTQPPLRVTDPNFPETRKRLNNAGIIDDSIRYKIAVEATNSRRTPTQTLEVWAQLRNRTDYSLQIECRVLWFDREEAPVDNPSSWQRIYLDPNSIGIYREFSTDIDQVAFYYIEIREGR